MCPTPGGIMEVKGPILGTVLLAGINPAGEPKYIDGTLLVAGLNASGEMEYLDPDNIGSGSALSTNNPANIGYAPVPGSGTLASKDDHVHDVVLTNAINALAAGVTLTTAATYYDGPSLSLAAGIWLVVASITVQHAASGANPHYNIKIWDGTIVYGSGESGHAGNSHRQVLTAVGLITLVSTTTIKVSATGSVNGGSMLAACINGDTPPKASQLVAVRIG